MTLKRFNKAFGIEDSIEKEQRRFVQRVNQAIFDRVEERSGYVEIFKIFCFDLGINAGDRIASANRGGGYDSPTRIPGLRSLTSDTFIETLKIVELVYDFFKSDDEEKKIIDISVSEIFFLATVDLGVNWKDGMFYPSGAKELDEKLIEESFEWLSEYPDEQKDFKSAVNHYIAKRYPDVVGDCYLTIEGLTRKVLVNSKTLENNSGDLIKTVNLSQEWKTILKIFINYAHEYKRHASEKRHDINPIEVEAYLYQTGLLVRLIIKSK